MSTTIKGDISNISDWFYNPTDKEIEEAEKLVHEVGGDTYESFMPSVRLSSYKMAKLIAYIRKTA